MPPIFTQHPLESLLVVSAFIFCCGIFTIISRRNAVSILMGVELVLNAANLNFIAFAQFSGHHVNGPDSDGWYLSTSSDTEFLLKDVRTTSIRFVQDIDVRNPKEPTQGSRRKDAPAWAELSDMQVFGADGKPIQLTGVTASSVETTDATPELKEGRLKNVWKSRKEPGQHDLAISWKDVQAVSSVRATFRPATFVEKFKIQYLDGTTWKDVPVASIPDGSGVHGFTFVLFVILLAAAEAAVALAIIIGIYQNFGKIDVDKATMLKE